MKLVKKLSIFALAALLAFGSACGGNDTTGDGSGSGADNGNLAYYGNPAEDFTKYDNRLYNEYL